MNHQPFRNWLLSEDTLSAEQIQSLQDHLLTCEACRQIESAWKEVEQAIHSTPDVEPEPGFTHRWQLHLAKNIARQQKRQGWTSIGITALIAVALIAILFDQLWLVFEEPGPYIAVWLNQLVGIISNIFILRNLFTTSSWLHPINILVGSFFVIGLISFMSVLWATAYKKFSLARRIE